MVYKHERKRLNNGMLIIPGEYTNTNLYELFDNQYKKYWRVHLAHPHKNPIKDIKGSMHNRVNSSLYTHDS